MGNTQIAGSSFAPAGTPVLSGVPSSMTRVATTGVNGYTLINGTGTILSWTAPNDGNEHNVLIACRLTVTSGETGGAITFICSTSGAGGTLLAGGSAIGDYPNQGSTPISVHPGETVTLQQSSALTLGAAKLFAEIWAA